MTDNTQELDVILANLVNQIAANEQRLLNGNATREETINSDSGATMRAEKAILDWNNKQNVHLLDKLAMLVKASQEVNQAFNGRPDCKSCNVQEELIEIIEAERNKLKEAEL